MFVIRPITLEDLDSFEEFANASSMGITNLPKNRGKLKAKIEESLASFAKQVFKPENETYLFVLEDQVSRTIGGTCGIFSKTGVTHPILSLQVDHEKKERSLLLLKVVETTHGPSEICGLYLSPKFREEGLGRLLSLSRFLFIGSFPHRFESPIFTEIRGVIRDDDTSPLYDSLGVHFSKAPFAQALQNYENDPTYLHTLAPEFPIYIPLISKEAQEVIGKPHPRSEPAMKMLLEEGFHHNDRVDFFDGGPHLEAETGDIRAIFEAREAVVSKIHIDPNEGDLMLVSNEKIKFRACRTQVKIDPKGFISLSEEATLALRVHPGDEIRYISQYAQKRGE